MKNNLKAILIAAALLGASAAQAQWAVYDNRVETAVKALVDAVRSSAQTGSMASTNAAGEIIKGVSDAQAAAEIRQLDDKYRLSPTACSAVASARGTADAIRTAGGGGGGGRGGGGSRDAAPGAVKAMEEAILVAEGHKPVPSLEVSSSVAVMGACETFVKNGMRAKRCADAGFSAKGTIGYENADILAQTLIDGPQDGVSYRRRLTINPRSKEETAVRALARNLNTPLELRELTSAQSKSDAARQYYAFKDSYEARISMASSPVDSFKSNRMASKLLIPVVEQLLKADASKAYVTKYLSANVPDWKKDGISVDEFMNLEVERSYMNEDWHKTIAGYPGEPVAKEQLLQTALQNVLLWRMTQSVERLALVSGQTAASLVRQEMTPTLNYLHGMAVSGSSSGRR